MINAIEQISITTLLQLYILFGIGIVFGTLLYRYFHTSSTEIFKDELEEYKYHAEEIINTYKTGFSSIKNEIENIQNYSSNNFEKINLSMLELNKILNSFNTNLQKVKELENELIKYKKILKRKEKRDD